MQSIHLRFEPTDRKTDLMLRIASDMVYLKISLLGHLTQIPPAGVGRSGAAQWLQKIPHQ